MGEVGRLIAALRGRVLALALDSRGCRVVQRVLDLADNEGQAMLASELRGHVREVLESPHANHVLQRSIEVMCPSTLAFVLTELLEWGRPVTVARHRYGCRVLERLIEHFPLDALEVFIDEILDDAPELCRHVYGNFVMQHLMEHGDQAHRRRVIEALREDLVNIALDQHACSVLDKALSYGQIEDQRSLASALLEEHGLLAAMACMRSGFAATQRLFKVVEGDSLGKAHQELSARALDIQRSKHGRALISAVAPEYLSPAASVSTPSRSQARGHAPSRSRN